MSKRSLSLVTLTPTATADATNLVDNTYHGFIQGGNSTQRVTISEVMLTGQAPTNSSPSLILLSRDSVVGTGAATFGAGGTDAALDGSATAPGTLPVVGNQFATTKPQRSATLHLWNLSINAFGGILKYVPPIGGEVTLVGSSASLGELSLSAYTGGSPGLLGSQIIYEVA